MRAINIHEAKTHLSRLVEEAARGEGFIIAKAGKPMVRVVAIEPAVAVDTSKRIGFAKDLFKLPPNFDEIDRDLDREIEKAFLESRLFPDEEADVKP